MTNFDLTNAISSFELLAKACGPLCRADGAVSRALCELYLTKGARSIQTHAGPISATQIDSAPDLDDMIRSGFSSLKLPHEETIQRAAQELLCAVDSGDDDLALRALVEMGVAGRCQTAEQQLSRVESLGRALIGRARLIFLIELSIFAIELGIHSKAISYIAEARNLDPDASELHDLNTVEGVIALGEGDTIRAISYLNESIRACLTDEYACLLCSIRAPNTILFEKLLECGQCESVVEYLIECKSVWDLHKGEISAWIDAIQRSEKPELLTSGMLGVMNHPSAKIVYLCTSALFPERLRGSTPSKSRAQLTADKEGLRADYRRLIGTAVKGKLGTSNN